MKKSRLTQARARSATLAMFALSQSMLLSMSCSSSGASGAALDAPSTIDTHALSDGSALADSHSTTHDAVTATNDYGSAGPDTVTMITATVSAPNSFSVDIYLPSSSGPHPVVMLSSGLEQTAAGYATYGSRLASWGIIAILRDDPGVFTSTSTIVDDVVYVIATWLPAQNTTMSSPLYGLVDTTKLALAGHSRGGEVSLLAAEGSAHGLVQGMFGLDPVDGTSAPEAITSIASIDIPLAFIGETTDDGSNGCAPSAENFLALYGSASSPAVAITATDADHTMFEDPANCTFCELCTAGTATQSVVEAEAARYLMAFFARVLLGDTSVGAAFEGAGIASDVSAGLVTYVSK